MIFDAGNNQVGLLEGIERSANFSGDEVHMEEHVEEWDTNDPFSTGLYFSETEVTESSDLSEFEFIFEEELGDFGELFDFF